MRVFLALELPEEIKKELAAVHQELKQNQIEARWANPDLSHLTLVFLSSITPDKKETIEKILAEISSQVKPVQLQLHQLGGFPSLAKAKIIFVDLQGELGKLHALAIKIRQRLKREKIPFDEKAFVAHLTLGRLKKPQNLAEIKKKIKVRRKNFTASQISLLESQLTPEGPIYKELKCVFLA